MTREEHPHQIFLQRSMLTHYQQRHHRPPWLLSPQGDVSEMAALKAKIATLRKDIDYLKSTDFSSLIKRTDYKDVYVTIGDVQGDGTVQAELDAKTDEELIATHVEEIRDS
ncbi:hypothetical protein H5410_040642 [Solanum commersonii]|uniref:Uncharacterized protein n=1 Tax=Solanum commersonii TaxID=4109 RepID=A0A9J5XSK6_SOLCO|nr:hypothetical protein H5410_040642 [Solanum commersonii]